MRFLVDANLSPRVAAGLIRMLLIEHEAADRFLTTQPDSDPP
jgi:predicted nuclease of predicted toxin-antitoxin system